MDYNKAKNKINQDRINCFWTNTATKRLRKCVIRHKICSKCWWGGNNYHNYAGFKCYGKDNGRSQIKLLNWVGV